jgi:hypothetical protein
MLYKLPRASARDQMEIRRLALAKSPNEIDSLSLKLKG